MKYQIEEVYSFPHDFPMFEVIRTKTRTWIASFAFKKDAEKFIEEKNKNL